MRRLLVVLALPLLILGCSGGNSRVVGTWKGQIEQPKNPKNLADMATGFAGAIMGQMTFEFNDDGKYKLSMPLGSKTGVYSVSGNEVTLKPDDSSTKGAVFILDGDSMHSKKDFDSDVSFALTRQPAAK